MNRPSALAAISLALTSCDSRFTADPALQEEPVVVDSTVTTYSDCMDQYIASLPPGQLVTSLDAQACIEKAWCSEAFDPEWCEYYGRCMSTVIEAAADYSDAPAKHLPEINIYPDDRDRCTQEAMAGLGRPPEAKKPESE